MVQCECISATNGCNPCTREGSRDPRHNPRFCWQHQNCTKVQKPDKPLNNKTDRELFTILYSGSNIFITSAKDLSKQNLVDHFFEFLNTNKKVIPEYYQNDSKYQEPLANLDYLISTALEISSFLTQIQTLHKTTLPSSVKLWLAVVKGGQVFIDQ